MNSSSHDPSQHGSHRPRSESSVLGASPGRLVRDLEGYAAPRVEPEPISRRALLAWGIGASGGLVGTGVLSPGAWARSVVTRRRVVWGLDPDGAESGCPGCRACHRHAHNKLFRSARAADRGRAHPHCQCAIVRAGTLAPATWRALFVRRDGTRRASVDRRTPRVHRLLRSKALRRIR
jgi:hypothetical protein